MFLMGNRNKYTPYQNSVSSVATEESEYESGQITTYEEDSGGEDEDLAASEEIILPDEEEEEEDVLPTVGEADEEILERQMSYPPLPDYLPPQNQRDSSPIKYTKGKRDSRPHPRERMGVLTPMEEVIEPPSSAGTEASGVHRRRRRSIAMKENPEMTETSSTSNNIQDDRIVEESNNNSDDSTQKPIRKHNSSEGSPRKVQFASRRSSIVEDKPNCDNDPSTSFASSEQEYGDSEVTNIKDSVDYEEETSENNVQYSSNPPQDSTEDQEGPPDDEPDPIQEQIQSITGKKLLPLTDELKSSSKIDAEFASILDDIISDLHTLDRLAEPDSSIAEIVTTRQDHLANVSSQLANCFAKVLPSTLMSNLPQIIPLLTTLVNLTQSSFRAQLSSLNAVTIFAEKLKDCKAQSGLKVLPNADLTWLVKTLCEISSENAKSVLKSVGTSALATLVKASGPEMIVEPILLILMGNDEQVPQRPEGSGKIVRTGVPGGSPKVKAIALDTLTFALLIFPRDSFNLEQVAKLACHCLLHPKRRIRQAALECLAVLAHAMGPAIAVAKFSKYVEEEIQQESASAVVVPRPAPPPSPKKLVQLRSHYDRELEINPEVLGPPSKIPVPIRVLEAQEKQYEAANPVVRPTPPRKTSHSAIAAITARISRHVLPTPNLEEMVEYGVKIPSNSPLIIKPAKRTGGEEDQSSTNGSTNSRTMNDRMSSSGHSSDSLSNIDYSLLELDPVLNSRGSGGRRVKSDSSMAADIEWIIEGIGPVKRYDPSTFLPKDANNMIPSTTKYRQWSSSLRTSGSESDVSALQSIGSTQSNTAMKRTGTTRGELMKDSFVQEPVLGRYYYSPNQIPNPISNQNLATKTGSRHSSKNSFTLLPSKYSVGNRGQGRRDLPTPSAPLPGAYDYSTTNGYHGGGGGSWDFDVGRKDAPISKQLQPMHSVREKFLETARRDDTLRSDSQHSVSTEEESDHEQYQSQIAQMSGHRRDSRTGSMNSITRTETNTNKSQYVASDGKPKEMTMQGINREYQVYHSHVEMNAPVPPPIYTEPTPSNKRTEADSAGSNHTRDSGVSVSGSKTPPSIHNTPPTHHRTTPGRNTIADRTRSSVRDNGFPIRRQWCSTPDVPSEVAEEDSDEGIQHMHRRKDSISSTDRDQTRRRSNPKLSQPFSSHEKMPVHRSPIHGRRGNHGKDVPSPVRNPEGPPYDSSSRYHNGSGDFLDEEITRRQENMIYNYRTDSTSSHKSLTSKSDLRNSASTGNISDASFVGRRIPASRSTYFEGSPKHGYDESFENKALSTEAISPRKGKGKIVPTKVYKGSYREINSRKTSNGNEVFPLDLKPVTSPRHALPIALSQLESSDWETNVDGFRQIVRMIRFDPDIIRTELHSINMTGIKHLTNLRSQVARGAILCFKELFTHLGRSMEPDCEKIAEKLMDKGADTNKFIREDSGQALESMITNITPVKCITCLDLFGTRHRNPTVRGMTARLAARLVEFVGPERCLMEFPERLLPMLCRFLQEGSLETRKYAKTAMSMLMLHPAFYSQLQRHVPEDVLRHAQKSIESLQK